jgi:hypothetical protein
MLEGRDRGPFDHPPEFPEPTNSTLRCLLATASSLGQVEYDLLGMGAGRCFLTCDGSDHDPKSYPSPAGTTVQSPVRRKIVK